MIEGQMELTRQGQYSTRDTALAAWLYSNGYPLADVDRRNIPVVFYFTRDSKKMGNLIRDFQVGRAEGNVVLFFRAYKKMLFFIKEGFFG